MKNFQQYLEMIGKGAVERGYKEVSPTEVKFWIKYQNSPKYEFYINKSESKITNQDVIDAIYGIEDNNTLFNGSIKTAILYKDESTGKEGWKKYFT
jgi:hypothetical protein